VPHATRTNVAVNYKLQSSWAALASERIMKTSSKQRRTSTTSSAGIRKRRKPVEASLPYHDWLVERLKDPAEAAAYVEAAIEQGHQPALMVALRQVAMAHGGIAEVARRAKLTREAAYRMLSRTGNPELRSLMAILSAAGLQLSIRPSGRTPKGVRLRKTRS
jgi:probable addiction module antidote protein